MPATNISAHRSPSTESASPGWNLDSYKLSKVTLAPEHIFDSGISLAKVCPETALLYAVLEDAFLCYQKQFQAGLDPVQRAAARDAEKWFFSDKPHELFSFVSVCAILGLEPGFIRKKLKASGPPCVSRAGVQDRAL